MINPSAIFSVQDYKKMLPYYRFYDANLWSQENPVVYFTNAGGTVTGDLKNVADILDTSSTPAIAVANLKRVVYWQDPTFQGFLPGATSDKIWRVIQKLAEQNQGPLAKRAPSELLRPGLALSLLGGK
jgi:hypothetical protein